MIRSPANPRPVRTGRYRYSKLRWRLLAHVLDGAGTVAMRALRCFRPPRVAADPSRILVVQLDHLGDSVLSSPLIENLRKAYPDASLDVLASPSNHEVFEADPRIDRVRVAEKTWFERYPGRWSMLRAVWDLGRSIRGEGYDLGIDVRGDILTVLVLAIGGIPRRVGWIMGGGGFLLTDVADWVRGRHEVRSRMALLEPLGIDAEPLSRAVVHVTDRDRSAAARVLSEAWPRKAMRRSEVPVGAGLVGETGGWLRSRAPLTGLLPSRPTEGGDALHAGRFGAVPPLLAIHTGAGTAAKRWPVRHWNALAQRFLQEGWRIVVVGGPDDLALSEALPRHDRLRNVAGKLSVTQTAALLERADLFIGADSGPAHLAASAGTLSVILFSGTNHAAQWRPWSRHSLVLRHRVSCSPCHQKACPLAGHPCMGDLTPDRVHRAAIRWWGRVHHAESPHNPI
ncbi:glycosyltransferase family 9 protein [Aquisphaera insulae]|uniref:glycosyltransferase family 9 protein n=1 Tax=Aquisphaera insulae TaxID=2712864 RepID=UPI0013EC1115|nr:glycosyltransferase family 9 protein [Aquisphaera insulae]